MLLPNLWNVYCMGFKEKGGAPRNSNTMNYSSLCSSMCLYSYCGIRGGDHHFVVRWNSAIRKESVGICFRLVNLEREKKLKYTIK
mmetsp:Transcript_10209/g.14067  ORF Transcript_10209/g.14067 Transcript_10209/m.14067 type:complete len:85 (+) Transcript_10209:778-1032(+)